MATSMTMALQAQGVPDLNEDIVNKVMGAAPMRGAAWENALACAQHFGMRATLVVPSTLKQVKAWTDVCIPVMIAWNPEGREWSHASLIYDVTDHLPEKVPEDCVVEGSGPGLYVWVADPNIPNPEKTTRIVGENEFYKKWYEKWPDYMVRRPALAIEREITPEGRQVMASTKRVGDSVAVVARSMWDRQPTSLEGAIRILRNAVEFQQDFLDENPRAIPRDLDVIADLARALKAKDILTAQKLADKLRRVLPDMITDPIKEFLKGSREIQASRIANRFLKEIR